MNYGKMIFAAVAVLLFSCGKEQEETTRPFRMGFTTPTRNFSSRAVQLTFNQLAAGADITNHQFDSGIPWQAALNGEPVDEAILMDWAERKAQTPTMHKVVVSLSALSHDGKGIADYLGTRSASTEANWKRLSFKDEAVRDAYLNYCRRLIRYFNPDYFNMNTDANMLFVKDASQWRDFLAFHQFVYAKLKSEYPSLVIFCSVVAAPMAQNAVAGVDHVQQKLAVLQLIECSDLYALSFKSSLNSAALFPDNVLATLFSVSEKPVAIAETSFDVAAANEKIKQVENPSQSKPKFISSLLKESEMRKATFILNFVLREHLLDEDDHTSMLRKMVLTEDNSGEKPPVVIWNNYQRRTFKP